MSEEFNLKYDRLGYTPYSYDHDELDRGLGDSEFYRGFDLLTSWQRLKYASNGAKI